MKNKFIKVISSLLIVAFLVSLMTVFASAETGSGESVDVSEVDLLINRTFDEGWDYTNGFTGGSEKNNNFYIDYEETSDYNYNYFLRMEASNGSDGFLVFNYASYVQKTNGTVVKMSFKADDECNVSGVEGGVGRILYAYTGTKEIMSLLAIKDGYLCVYTDKNDNLEPVAPLTNDWLDIAFVFDWDEDDFFFTFYYGENYAQSFVVSYPFKTVGDAGFTSFRLGLPSTTGADAIAERIGTSYCVDNFQVYQNTKALLDNETLDAMGAGELVNRIAEKPINIMSGTGKSTAQLLEEALCMKVGVDYVLFRNEKRAIFDGTYGAPEFIDGNIMISLDLLLDYIGFPYYVHADKLSYDITTGTSKTNLIAGRDSASVNGERVELNVAPGFVTEGDKSYLVIALDDIETLFPGWLVTYDDMGLIIVYEDLTPDNAEDNEEIVNRENNLTTMVDIMKKFIFINVTEDANGYTLKEAESYTATGLMVYNDVKAHTNNFKHPYIAADQATFDKLYKVYTAVPGTEHYDEKAKAYLDSLLPYAENFYNEVAELNADGSYKQIKPEKIPVNEYSDGKNPDPSDPTDKTVADTSDGYDPDGGRLNSIGDHAVKLQYLAFGYQITRDEKYAKLAYDWAVALGEWEHWGPGHFLNCAEATLTYSMSYDWLYNAYFELHGQAGVDKIAQIIFEKGVHDGYVSSSGKTCEHPRSLGDGSRYHTANSNWNAVCSAGMIAGSLAIMEYDQYATERNYLVGNNMINLAQHGLDEYAPDGSYIESASYWAYGTNYFFRMVMSLYSATGKDYGFMDTWGIDKTCYYACQIESSDGRIWNYHDGGADGFTNGGLGRQDTSTFFFVGKMLGDNGLIAIRQQHLGAAVNRKSITIYDMLYYPFEAVSEKVELPLDYHMDGIDAFVSRSSWETGAMYTGLMGGLNNVNHGQLDSGNFIYHNKGIVWFMDLGSDQYNAYGYFGSSRNNYYRCNAEGQNVVCLVSDPENVKFGQYSGAGGNITDTYINEHGSYAILDNTSVYLDNAVFARRGIFVTNDRNTVVVQDEITFKMIEEVYWIAHTAHKIEIDDTGRVAYLTAKNANGESYTLRASLVARTRAFSFSQLTADQFLLSATFGPKESVNKGGVAEYSRAGISRLLIRGDQVLSFNVAVAFEVITGDKENAAPVAYEWTPMGSWEPYAVSTDESDVNQLREEPSDPSVVKTVTARAEALYEDGSAFSDKLSNFFRFLCQVRYTIDFYGSDLPTNLIDYYDTYLDLEEAYEEFREVVNENVNLTCSFASRLQGEEAEAEEE